MSSPPNILERLRAYTGQAEQPSAEVIAKREVAAQLRQLNDAIGGSLASAPEMREIARQLGTLAAALEVTREVHDSIPEILSVIPGMENFRDRSPITGHANPLAPPAALAPDLEAEVVRGEVIFGAAFEGAPGCAHGGFVAALLDEALGMACIFSGGPAMTAELTTRYLRHTPVGKPLRVEARLDDVDGRKIRASGEVYDANVVVAEGTGLFIAVDVEKFKQLLEDRSERTEG
jgi:acyl-coenzyme A thioesterase PaaI-like protein